jgi:hypothetical protein
MPARSYERGRLPLKKTTIAVGRLGGGLVSCRRPARVRAAGPVRARTSSPLLGEVTERRR